MQEQVTDTVSKKRSPFRLGLRAALTVLKYAGGVLCWLIVLGLLKTQCVFDLSSVVDGLWMNELQGDLVENALGDVALHVERGRCVDTYIYVARYYPDGIDGMTGRREYRNLSSLVDQETWRVDGWDSITTTYLDAKYRYVLYTISDGEFINVEDR